jgi:hypothetical protein
MKVQGFQGNCLINILSKTHNHGFDTDEEHTAGFPIHRSWS